MQGQRHVVIGTPSAQDRLMEVWVSMAGHYICNDYSAPLRTREESLIAYCREGGGVLQMGTREYQFGAGDILLQPAHIAHICACLPDVGWDVRWVIFGGSYAHQLLELTGCSPMQPILHIGDHLPLWESFGQLYSHLEQKHWHTQLDASKELLSLLIELRKRSQNSQVDGMDWLQHISYKTETLEELVAASGYSKHHYIRLFKRATGMTPWAYVLKLKVDKAKELLLHSEHNVKQVAALVGIQNPLYFSRLFRKLTGISPSQYKHQGLD